ncbi:MAG: sulfatase-like hydrolase/transferase, partial [Solirubrobacterales bacterium]
HNGQKWAGGLGGTATTWQRHFIQTGYADTLTRRLIKRLKGVGIWNRALVIVTADHGISFDPGTFRRIAFPGNFAAVANPPLFIKYPGQRMGKVSDAHTRTVDIVPTTTQVLGVEKPYAADGEPISEDGTADGSGSDRVYVSSALKRVVSEPLSRMLSEREAVLRRQARWLGARTGPFQLGPRPDMLGRRVPVVKRRSARIDRRLDFGNVRLGGGRKVPAFVNGSVGGGRAGEVIAIGVNGRIAATCRAFRFRGRTRWGALVPPSSLRAGRNSIGVYLVRGRRLVPLGGT